MSGLVELLNIVLSNIQAIDIEILERITELLPKSQTVGYYSAVFNFALEYFKNQKELPSVDFLAAHYSTWTRTNEPLSKEAINILLFELQKDSAITDTVLALQSRDLEQARSILDKSVTKCDFTETKSTDICQIYDSMNELPEGLQIGVPELDEIYKNFSYGTNNFIAAPQTAG